MKAGNILDEITAKTRDRIAQKAKEKPLAELKAEAEAAAAKRQDDRKSGKGKRTFYEALSDEGMSYICEVKKASPSKGVIAEEFPYLDIAKQYESAGASAISCLTEPYYFQGANEYLEKIAEAVDIPVLRKDFTVNDYMIYEAATLGASAVLLICSVLTDSELKSFRELAEKLGMEALVEAHDEEEVQRALDAGAKIIGVNNRNLKTFEIDMGNSIALREKAPRDVLFVSESGIKTHEDIQRLYDNDVDAVLIGETLMRSSDKKKMLEELNGAPLREHKR